MPFDPEIARRFIAAVPAGRWATYGDVAAVGGDPLPMAAFRAGQWLAGSEESIDNYWRVIDVDGRVPEEFTGGGLGPRTADEARDWLRREGVRLDALGRADSRQRFHPWNWVDDSEAAKTATTTMIERHTAQLPAELPALQALAALNRLGRAQRALGRRDEAAETFGRVLTIDRQNRVARKHLLELAKELPAS